MSSYTDLVTNSLDAELTSEAYLVSTLCIMEFYWLPSFLLLFRSFSDTKRTIFPFATSITI